MAKIIKNGQNMLFLKNVWFKINNVLTLVIYIIMEGAQYVWNAEYFFPKNSGFATEANFDSITEIPAIAMILKLFFQHFPLCLSKTHKIS